MVFVRSIHQRKMVNHELKDYTVNTAITFHTGFDDRECNCLMYEGMKEMIKHDIQTAFLSDESLKGYITSDFPVTMKISRRQKDFPTTV